MWCKLNRRPKLGLLSAINVAETEYFNVIRDVQFLKILMTSK